MDDEKGESTKKISRHVREAREKESQNKAGCKSQKQETAMRLMKRNTGTDC